MRRSVLFSDGAYKSVEKQVASYLNRHETFLSSHTVRSTRAAGDAMEQIVAGELQNVLGDYCNEYNSQFARRAMQDIEFTDRVGLRYAVDVKTHNLATEFNMPNLTSAKRLVDLYADDRNYFVLLMIKYELDGVAVRVRNVHFVPIEYLSWECLGIGALGWGQIQIANANNLVIDDGPCRRSWMSEFDARSRWNDP